MNSIGPSQSMKSRSSIRLANAGVLLRFMAPAARAQRKRHLKAVFQIVG